MPTPVPTQERITTPPVTDTATENGNLLAAAYNARGLLESVIKNEPVSGLFRQHLYIMLKEICEAPHAGKVIWETLADGSMMAVGVEPRGTSARDVEALAREISLWCYVETVDHPAMGRGPTAVLNIKKATALITTFLAYR